MKNNWMKRLAALALAALLALPAAGLAETPAEGRVYGDGAWLELDIEDAIEAEAIDPNAAAELGEIDLFELGGEADGSPSEDAEAGSGFALEEGAGETPAAGDEALTPSGESAEEAPADGGETGSDAAEADGEEAADAGDGAEEDAAEEDAPGDANACEHELDMEYDIIEETGWKSADKQTHKNVIRAASAVVYCTKCGEVIETVPLDREVTLLGSHSFKTSGKYMICKDCGYKVKVCKHSKYHALNGSVVYSHEYVDSGFHMTHETTRGGYAANAYVCNSCGMVGIKDAKKKMHWDAAYVAARVGEGEPATVNTLEPHEFVNGYCASCGMWQTFETMALNAGALTLGVKETFQLTVEGCTLRAGSGVAFSSSDPAVAAVDAKTGKITGKKVGAAVITAQAEYGPSSSVEVSVLKAPSKVAISAKAGTLGVGDAGTLTATVPGGSASRITFSSSNAKVVKITGSADGTCAFTALKKGTATITAKTFNGKKAACKVTVKAAPKSVAFTAKSLLVSVGQTRSPGVKLTSGSAASYAFSSSDETVVRAEGRSLLAVGEGEAIVTVRTHNDRTAELPVAVVAPPEAMWLNLDDESEDAVTLGVKETFALPVAFDTDAPVDVTYTSDNTAVAAVSAAGKVTAKKAGTAQISIETHNGLQAACAVKVLKAPGKVTLSKKTLTMYAGDDGVLKAALPSGTASRKLAFSSSNAKVVKITGSKNGECMIYALKKGTATITVKTFNGKKATCKVTVKAAVLPTGLTLSPSAIGVPVNGTAAVSPIFKPSNTTSKRLEWSVADPEIASVADGVVTGLREGETTVYARSAVKDGVYAACRVIVCAEGAAVPVSDIELTVPGTDLRKGDTVKLGAVAVPGNAANAALKWASSDVAVATVGQDGLVTAVGEGSAIIRATAQDGGGATAGVVITVTDVRYRALLVSESDFYWPETRSWERISRNKGDVAAMKKMLQGVRGAEGGKYDITTADDTTKAGLKALIASTFADADETDVSLFFIATHGDSSAVGDDGGALCMSSPSAKRPDFMRVGELRDCLLAVPGRVIVVIESCGSGAAVYSNAAGSSVIDQLERQAAAFDAEVVQAFSEADPGIAGGGGVYANTGELLVSNKFYVLTASRYLEDSYGTEGANPGNFFTSWLTAGVGKSGSMPADTRYKGNKDGVVDLLELYGYISGVGDNQKIRVGGTIYYQHVQVYPAERYELFR